MSPVSPNVATRPIGVTIPAAFWLAGTVFLALLVYYFVGVDQGAVSLVSGDTHVHEFLHDARHLLGFPCH
ncbi:MAG: CbtB-domain containing protein [Actinobacteria bacterium]|nr:CbtB-domain containing protein [Actinomycetota bacterium]